ncbi:MAG: PaaI family thioesterase [Muribaculaceae bacterium]|nr:PaaI family thioesterase [Muribaculaceae bacterium]
MACINNLEALKEYFLNDTYAMSLGFNIVEGCAGGSVITVDIQPNHLNGVGIPHGGFLYSLGDFAGAVATNAYGFVSLSIDSSISYLNKTKGNMLIAKATELSRSHRFSYIEIDIKDELDTLVARFKGTYYITEKEIII